MATFTYFATQEVVLSTTNNIWLHGCYNGTIFSTTAVYTHITASMTANACYTATDHLATLPPPPAWTSRCHLAKGQHCLNSKHSLLRCRAACYLRTGEKFYVVHVIRTPMIYRTNIVWSAILRRTATHHLTTECNPIYTVNSLLCEWCMHVIRMNVIRMYRSILSLKSNKSLKKKKAFHVIALLMVSEP